MSTTTLPNETTLLTADNKPPGRICLVAGTLYVQDNKTGAATRLKKYAEGDYYDQKGVPGIGQFGRPLDAEGKPVFYHRKSVFFNSYRKTLHGGRYTPKYLR